MIDLITICMITGSITIDSILFATGNVLYGHYTTAAILIALVAIAGYLANRSRKKPISNSL